MEEALGDYYRKTFGLSVEYLDQQKALITDDPLLEEGLLVVKKIPSRQVETGQVDELHKKLISERRGKKEKRAAVNLMCLLMELYLDEYDEMKTSLTYLRKEKFKEHDELKKVLDLVFQVRVLRCSIEEEVESNFRHFCDMAPDDFNLSLVLWHIRTHNYDVRPPLLLDLAFIADEKRPFRISILGFKAVAYKLNDQPLEALYVYAVILHQIRENKKAEQTLPGTYYLMAEGFFEIENLPKAIDFCNKAARESQERDQENLLPGIYSLRGQAFLMKGETEKGRSDLNAALEMDPENEEVQELLNQVQDES
jgi:tetratricopeptide (TPR) repeat protein